MWACASAVLNQVEGSFGANHVTPRFLTSELLNQLVCVEGIVTKCLYFFFLWGGGEFVLSSLSVLSVQLKDLALPGCPTLCLSRVLNRLHGAPKVAIHCALL